MNKHILAILMVVASGAVPAFAHHSFAAEYDSEKRVTLQGTVTKFEFINPHGWIYLEVKDDAGNTAPWAAEMGNVNALLRRGWNKNSLKPGTEVIILGVRAKDGSNTVNARSVKLPDGRELFAGSSGQGGQ